MNRLEGGLRTLRVCAVVGLGVFCVTSFGCGGGGGGKSVALINNVGLVGRWKPSRFQLDDNPPQTCSDSISESDSTSCSPSDAIEFKSNGTFLSDFIATVPSQARGTWRLSGNKLTISAPREVQDGNRNGTFDDDQEFTVEDSEPVTVPITLAGSTMTWTLSGEGHTYKSVFTRQ